MAESKLYALLTDRDGRFVDPAIVSQRTRDAYPAQFWGAQEAARQNDFSTAQVGIDVARYVQATLLIR